MCGWEVNEQFASRYVLGQFVSGWIRQLFGVRGIISRPMSGESSLCDNLGPWTHSCQLFQIIGDMAELLGIAVKTADTRRAPNRGKKKANGA
jgi:hypothetical protein